jgi:hypothetical protein
MTKKNDNATFVVINIHNNKKYSIDDFFNINKLESPTGRCIFGYIDDDQDLAYVCTLLNSKRCPENLGINLFSSIFSNDAITQFAQALLSNNCPPDLELCWRTPLQEIWLNELANVIKSKNCPKGLALNLHALNIGDTGASKLADALVGGAKSICLDLSCNNIDVKGIKAIATALQSKKCLRDLTLDLSGNSLTEDAIMALASAIVSEKIPKKLRLTVGVDDNNYVTFLKFIQFLTNKPPHGELQLIIDYTGESNSNGAQILKKALVELMVVNTSIIKLEEKKKISTFFNPSEKEKIIIDFCCLRNQLIQRHPHLESFIKKISYQAGMYRPGMKTPILSLQNMSANMMIYKFHLNILDNDNSNKEIINDALRHRLYLDVLDADDINDNLKDYILELIDIRNEFRLPRVDINCLKASSSSGCGA